MASSTAVITPPPPESLNIDVGDGDEDVEYEEIEEEIEVEEEVEVEEEIEVEEEVNGEEEEEAKGAEKDEDNDFGEDLTPLHEENQVIDMDLEDDEEYIQSAPVIPGLSVSNPPIDIPTAQTDVGHVKVSESIEKGELHVNVERTSIDNDPKALYCSGKVIHATKASLVEGFNTGFITADASRQKDNFIISASGVINNAETGNLANIIQMSPRLHVPEVRFREPSSIAEFDRENKKLRIMCEFHAKGWCIKGNSCRFLHTKDGLDGLVKKNEASNASSSCVLPQQSGKIHESNYGTDLLHSHSKQPLSFGSSSWNNDALGTRNLLKSGLQHHASASSSLQRGISVVPCSESENLLRNHKFGDVNPDESKAKSSSGYWMPSIPFRPSHAITQNLLLKANLYDPIRDSIAQADVKDARVKFSHSDQGSSVKNVNVQSNSSPEERLLDTVHFGDDVKDNKLSSSSDNKRKFDEQKPKAVVKVDGSGKNVETVVDFKRDGHVQNESKADLKRFQSELIEFVKELVRPTWNEGLLSRDAHKLIVKKTVGKVICSFQPHQIPSTGEMIKLYLSSSQPKLAKLVHAYIEKYGKP